MSFGRRLVVLMIIEPKLHVLDKHTILCFWENLSVNLLFMLRRVKKLYVKNKTDIFLPQERLRTHKC